MKNYNPTLNLAMVKTFNLKGETSADVADYIQPISIISAPTDLIRTATRTATGTSTIFTTSTTKDTFITGVLISLSTDVNANVTQCECYVNQGGAARSLARISHALGAAGNNSVFIPFDLPFKPDRGVAVSFAVVSAVGVFSGTANVYGYEQETLQGSSS